MNKPFRLILTGLGGIIPFGFKCTKSRSFVGSGKSCKMITVDDDSCVLHTTLKQTRWALQKQEPISWTVMRNQAIHDSCTYNSVDYNIYHFTLFVSF